MADTPPTPERIITLRVYGSILYETGAWNDQGNADPNDAADLAPQHIEQWMETCRAHRLTTVLWQSNCGGTSTHPSPVFPLPGPPLKPHNQAWQDVWDFLGRQLRRFDTLDVAIRAAHDRGLRFAYALCPFDFVDSPFEQSPFHPDLWVQSRTGDPFLGVPCLAEPKVLDLILQHVCDVLDRGIDDLVISPFCHTVGLGQNTPDHYGFNPPIIEAYKQQHGTNPVTDPVIPAHLHQVPGRLLHHIPPSPSR